MNLYELFESKNNPLRIKESRNSRNLKPGDKVYPEWESDKDYEPMVVVSVSQNSVKVKDDWGNTHIFNVKDLKKAMSNEGRVREARSDSFTRKLSKAFWWGDTNPKDILDQVKKFSDEQLLNLLHAYPYEKNQAATSGTPRNFQIKAIKRELRRRGYRDFEKYMNENKIVETTIKLCESMTRILTEDDDYNYEGGIDFEPQPEMRGLKGITRDTGYGTQHKKLAQKTLDQKKFNDNWARIMRVYRNADAATRKRLLPKIKGLAQAAKAKGLTVPGSID